MIAVLVLLYCLYVVQDWLDMLTHDQVKEAHMKSLKKNIDSVSMLISDEHAHRFNESSLQF